MHNPEYMWNEYAKVEGVVLEIDDTIFVPNKEMTMVMSKPCLYAGILSDEEFSAEDFADREEELLHGQLWLNGEIGGKR